VKPKITDKYDYFDIIAKAPSKGQTFDDLFGAQSESLCKMPTSL
jgi:branched-chain amino acid transport system substrate-binding protein